MRTTKRQLRKIIREAIRRTTPNTTVYSRPKRRRLISEVDTSAEGSFSQKYEKVEVYMPGVGEDGTYAYQHADGDQIAYSDLKNWLTSEYLDGEPTMSSIGDDIGYDEEELEEYKEAWKKLVELGLDEWDSSDREKLASNIEAAIEDGEDEAQSW